LKVLVAAQRSKQIRNGARPLVQIQGVKATRLALEEVKQGLISFDFKPVEWNAELEPGRRADSGSADAESGRAAVNQSSAAKLTE
jgi:DNA-directed RNA polymerase subunit K/omega